MVTERTRTLLEHLSTLHEELANHYHRLAETQQSLRLKMLLDYLGEHEERLVTTLREYEKSDDVVVLDSWFRWADEPNPVEMLAEVKLPEEATEDEVLEAAMRVSQSLIDYYRGLSQGSIPEHIAEVLDNVIRHEEKSLEQVARDTGRFRDL